MTNLFLNKRAFFCGLFIFFLLIGVSQAVASESDLFTPYAGPLQLDPQSVNPALVLRQRLVSIRFELLPMSAGQAVTLNLFEDVVVRAICDSVEASVSNGFVWNGRIPDLPGARVTLAVANQSMAATVTMAPLVYHIRPFQDQVHVVREIRPPALRAERPLADMAPSAVEQEVLELVNLERQSNNIHPLAWDNALGTAARGHSTDMAQNNYFSHTSLDGRLFYQRIADAGYAFSTCGENIAGGYSSPQAVMNGWMNSSGHRANILSSAYCDLGVGYAFGSSSTFGHYWTQDFGRRQGVSVCTLTQYTITATAGPHGRIQPSGSVKVQSGASQTFHITPDTGYRILDVRVDGASIGKVATHTFDSVTSDHTIEAYFEEASHDAKPTPWIPPLLLGD